MTIANISTSYLAGALLSGVRQTQSQLANLEVESSTGQYADLGLQLGYQSGYEMSLRTQNNLLQTMTTANGLTEMNLENTQTALSSITSSAQSAAQQVAVWTSESSNPSILQSIGQTQLQQFLGVANTATSTGYLFGGENSSVAPLNNYYSTPPSSAKTAIDTAFQNYFGFSTSSPQVANITSSQLQGFLSGPYAAQFQSPLWGANWSNASSVNKTAQIAPGNSVVSSTNANTTGFQQLAQGYAMLSEFANIGLGVTAQQTLASNAAGLISGGSAALTNTQANLGVVQDQITQANNEMGGQMTLMQTEIGRLDNVDPAQVATQLTTLTSQLQTAYQLTAQIHSLNLAQYLPT